MVQQVFTNRYEILRHLARGGMAEVYLARDRLLDRQVALKVLFSELSADPSFVERFRREAQAAANLNHPNIVSVYDWGQEGSTYFIVMEYVEGPTLRDLLRAEGRLHADRAADIAADIAAALAFAHHNGVIHRDVKPGNVLLSPSGQVKVTDFGIARAARDGAEEHLTQTGAVMGTATYFSPEQAQGHNLDARTDIYALGVVLYEMVTGRVPFLGDNPLSIAYQHVRATAPPPSRVNPDVPGSLEAIITKALAKDPEDRYASASEMRADLRRFREGRTVGARRISFDTTVASPAASAPTASSLPLATPPRVATPPGGRRGKTIGLVALVLAALGLGAFFLYRTLNSARTTVVPDVASKTFDDAVGILSSQGLRAVREDVSNGGVTPGVVFDQEPRPGNRVDRNSEVRLKVSSGPAPVPVSDVKGKNADEARSLLVQAGFKVAQRTQSDENVSAGRVIDQQPEAGTPLKPGQTVTLVVSSGQPKQTVPDVSGEDPTTAANELGQKGFKVAQKAEDSATVTPGQVIRTDPPAGADATKGSAVTLFISSGVRVPNLIGTPRADATAKLQAAGLSADTSESPTCPPNRNGQVIAQNPAPDTRLAGRSTVALTVCRRESSPTTTTTTTTTRSSYP